MSIINLKLEPGDKLKPCPFCGEFDDCLELQNTHTPSYWVACLNCSAEVHGDYFGEAYDFDRECGGHLPSHEKAKASAIAKWNRRDYEEELEELRNAHALAYGPRPSGIEIVEFYGEPKYSVGHGGSGGKN